LGTAKGWSKMIIVSEIGIYLMLIGGLIMAGYILYQVIHIEILENEVQNLKKLIHSFSTDNTKKLPERQK
jgi:hypothetical protein